MGAQEVHFPALLPREPYERTGRWTEYGDDIFRLKDRKGADYLLGPTHEEMFTLLVKDLYSSYKDLPLWIYQIQTKYRDEARPRAGPAARARVRHEGLLLLRRRRRRPRRVLRRAPRGVHPDLRPARPRLRHRLGDVRGDGRLAQRGVPRRPPRTARTPTCAARTCDYAANIEAVRVPVPAGRCRTTTCPPRTSRTPRTRPRSTRSSRWPTAAPTCAAPTATGRPRTP